jgi:hypothetical protein
LAAALIAVSFWPLASSREALRAGMMPFFAAGAMVFFLLLLRRAQVRVAAKTGGGVGRRDWLLATGLSLYITATLYNYLAARVLWLVFPLFLIYLILVRRSLWRKLWLPVLAGLSLSALAVLPMFLYLQRHPEAQTRLQMFGGVLGDLLQGNLGPLLQKASGGLLAFVWPGAGDQFLAYNLPGRPVLMPWTALFFVVGIGVCFLRWRQPRYVLLLLWFVVGVTPSLLTGATANTTRNVGAMPPAFLLPAVGFVAVARRFAQGKPTVSRAMALVGIAWLALAAWSTASDYFVRWARAPEVRAAYMHTLVEQLAYVKASGDNPVVVSSERPGPAHNQSIGLVLLPERRNLRWVDVRRALIVPPTGRATVLVPASTPLHPAFESWLAPAETIELRADDLDPSFAVFVMHQTPHLPVREDPVPFGDDGAVVTLLGSRWLTPQVRAGEIAELLQVWRVDDAARVGPYIAAIGGSDVVLFTHLLDSAGSILSQDDRLDAPSASWQTGDIVVQVHRLPVPQQMAPGAYTTVVGIYDRASQQPLAVLDEQGRWDATRATVDSLNIIP